MGLKQSSRYRSTPICDLSSRTRSAMGVMTKVLLYAVASWDAWGTAVMRDNAVEVASDGSVLVVNRLSEADSRSAQEIASDGADSESTEGGRRRRRQRNQWHF